MTDLRFAPAIGQPISGWVQTPTYPAAACLNCGYVVDARTADASREALIAAGHGPRCTGIGKRTRDRLARPRYVAARDPQTSLVAMDAERERILDILRSVRGKDEVRSYAERRSVRVSRNAQRVLTAVISALEAEAEAPLGRAPSRTENEL